MAKPKSKTRPIRYLRLDPDNLLVIANGDATGVHLTCHDDTKAAGRCVEIALDESQILDVYAAIQQYFQARIRLMRRDLEVFEAKLER